MAELLVCRRATDQVGGVTARDPITEQSHTIEAVRVLAPTEASAPETEYHLKAEPASSTSRSDRAGGAPSLKGLPFAEVWVVDFEFSAKPGENPEPVCLVAWELRSGRKVRLWRDEFGATPPYPTGRHSLFVAYYASAEIGCHLALNWPVPERGLDLFTEFRNHTNGISTPSGAGLLGALTYHGLDGIGAVQKDEMRALVLRGGPWSPTERVAILDYCESDVASLKRLLLTMLPHIDLPRALLRGRYMTAIARMERNGVPIDTGTLELLRRHWSDIQDHLIAEIDGDYGVYDGRTFKEDHFASWLARNSIPWPLHPSGRLDLSDDTFREMARAYPAVAPLRELRAALSQMRLSDLAVGRDSRNRTMLSAFRARTGRNQPSNAKFIFGPAVWLRGLIQPPPGHGIAYIDWQQQEFGIAAALSGDPRMMEAYRSGDPYLAFAKQAGAAPADATKATHKTIRDQFKSTSLAVLYGMGADALAQRIGQPPIRARAAPPASRNLPSVLAVVRCCRRSRHADRQSPYRFRMASAGIGVVERAFPAEFSDAGEWCGNAPSRLLPRDRTGHRGLCTRS